MLIDLLNEDMKQAMKNKEKAKLSVIRMVKASLQNEAINKGTTLSESDELTILSRELKQRKDSLEQFAQAGREDLVENLKNEIVILETYLPQQLTNEELVEVIKQTIAEVGATNKADMGKVMSAIMPKTKGKADGSVINKLVQQML